MSDSLYGNYRNPKFTDIYPDHETFLYDYANVGIGTTIKEENAKTLYYLLYARYGNSVIANSDQNQFKYKLFSLVFQFGPSWEKKMDIQKLLRDMSDDELMAMSKTIVNQSSNPSSEPTTASLEELETINSQNVFNEKRGKLPAYERLWAMIVNDVTEPFLKRFRTLFLVVVEPEIPLWYITDIESSEEGE